METEQTLECIECGSEVLSGFNEDWGNVYECQNCGRVYDTSNYTVDEWANMFDLNPQDVADEWGIEYIPDNEDDNAG